MTKVTKGPQPWLNPMPALLIGAVVEGKPTFMTVAWGGVANGEPPMVSLAIRPHRYTLLGIRENSQFSVNVPSISQIKEVDYCGIRSGDKNNKVEKCGFDVFYGTLENAPLIEQCPINLECTVKQIVTLDSHLLVIGLIAETHVSDDCLDEQGAIDFATTDPEYLAAADFFAQDPHPTSVKIGRIVNGNDWSEWC